MTSTYKRYLSVTKPGIIMGNAISVTGGFLLASRGDIDYWLLLATLIGLSLVVASGCVINNCIDRDIDGKMQRTASRVTVTGELPLRTAMLHGAVLGIAGFGLLALYTNLTAVFFAAFGYVIYVGVYSLYMKRNSVYGTFVGSLSGAVPPAVGYMAAAILLGMFSIWQMPHSYAIAIFRYNDYKAAGIPVLPVSQGIAKAKRHIVLHIALFALVVMLLPLSGYTGIGFLTVAFATSLWWLLMALRGYRPDINVEGWAKRVFGFSIVNITLLSVAMSVDYHTTVDSLFAIAL